MRKLIAYMRVSTRRQGESGLGLEGQLKAVTDYASREGAVCIAQYTEIESGRRSDRPKLAEALEHARSARATLVVAKLDRLARNVAFLSALLDCGCDFVACDNPHANRLTVQILSVVAEDEARRISERTKAALAAAKARGTKLGSARPGHWEGREHRRGWAVATKIAAANRTKAAAEGNRLVCRIIGELRAAGATWAAVAVELNARGHVSRRGNPWTAQTACQVANQLCSKVVG